MSLNFAYAEHIVRLGIPAGRLCVRVLGGSQTNRDAEGLLPAIDRYDGASYWVVEPKSGTAMRWLGGSHIRARWHAPVGRVGFGCPCVRVHFDADGSDRRGLQLRGLRFAEAIDLVARDRGGGQNRYSLRRRLC